MFELPAMELGMETNTEVDTDGIWDGTHRCPQYTIRQPEGVSHNSMRMEEDILRLPKVDHVMEDPIQAVTQNDWEHAGCPSNTTGECTTLLHPDNPKNTQHQSGG